MNVSCGYPPPVACVKKGNTLNKASLNLSWKKKCHFWWPLTIACECVMSQDTAEIKVWQPKNAAKICFKLRRCKYIQGSGVEWYSGTQHYLYQFWLLSTSLWLLQGHSTQKQLTPPVTETLLMKQRFSKQTIFKSLIIVFLVFKQHKIPCFTNVRWYFLK